MALPVLDNEGIIEQITTVGGEKLPRKWLGAVVEYSVPDLTPPSGAGSEFAGFVAMGVRQQMLAREAFELWDDLIALDLREVVNRDARLTMAYTNNTTRNYSNETTRRINDPDLLALQTDRIWLRTDVLSLQESRIKYGGNGFSTMLHEVGHGIGLYHPGDYDASDPVDPTYTDDAEYAQDTEQYTVMSYFAANEDGSGANHQGSFAATPLLHDILAAQAHYGADMTTRPGDTTYGFNSTAGRFALDFTFNPKPVIAIWDAGGTDTLDTSGYTMNQRIDLRAGKFSDVGGLTQNVAIAFGATIENATGGSRNDTIRGNKAPNALFGLAGDDRLTGDNGGDTLDGGKGSDIMIGGLGNDSYYVDTAATVIAPLKSAQAAADAVRGDRIIELSGQGVDTVYASINYKLSNTLDNLTLIGSAQKGTGNAFANTLYGNARSNTLAGFEGTDTLHGRSGNDTLIGGGGRDFMEGHAGHDTFVYTLASDSTKGLRDTIIRFRHSEGDKIDLSAIDARPGGGNNAFVFIGTRSFAEYDSTHPGTVGMVRASGGIVQVDIGGDHRAEMEIKVTGRTFFTESDFTL